MNILIRSATLACLAALLGCQQAGPQRIASSVDAAPPVINQPSAESRRSVSASEFAASSQAAQTPAAGSGRAMARAGATSPVNAAPPTPSTGPAAPSAARSATPSAASASGSQKRASAIITVHLAQEKAEAPLVAVDVGGASLYALPQPVLTQTDIAQVSPVTGPDQRTYMMLELTPAGARKLQSVTQQARGHYLLLSVQGQLVNVARINETIQDGRLLVGTQNAQHTRAILQLMQGQ